MSVAQSRAAPRAYDGVLQGLHWTVVLLVLLQFGSKLLPIGALGATEDGLNRWHLAIGPTILLLMVFRLLWRLTHRVPPPPRDLAPALRFVSRATHWLFYGLLILLPILGWISASAYGAPATLLGLVRLPMLVAQNKALAEQVGAVHGFFAWVLLAVIALHFGGAVFHAFRRDGVAGRMIPGGDPGPP